MRNSQASFSEVRTGAADEYLSSDCVGTITWGIESGGNVCSTTSKSYKEVSLSNARFNPSEAFPCGNGCSCDATRCISGT
jgi:hypothetical protein